MTTQETFDQIIAEKQSGNYPELDTLNSTSKVSVWRLLVWIFAFFSKAIQELFDSFKLYVETVFAKNQAGTLQWWVAKIKDFQLGDTLQFLDGVFKYAAIDDTKKIVKQIALENLNQIVVFKAVKADVDGNLIPLEDDEPTQLLQYINTIKFPGTFVSLISQPADDVRLSLRVYYDALLDKTIIETNIKLAISDYISNIVFNGKFIPVKLIDRVQQVAGVVNPIILSLEHKNYNEPDTEFVPVGDFFIAKAGYAAIAHEYLTLELLADV